jgi:hypothetical protein
MARNGCLGCFGLIALFMVIGAISNSIDGSRKARQERTDAVQRAELAKQQRITDSTTAAMLLEKGVWSTRG